MDNCKSLREQKNYLGAFLLRADPESFRRFLSLRNVTYRVVSAKSVKEGFLSAVKNGGDSRVQSLRSYDDFEKE